MLLINGLGSDELAVTDRAFQYGDGIFTTMLVKAGRVCDWPRHLERLKRNAATLFIEGVDWQSLEAWVNQAALSTAESERAVLKVIVTRGSGGRGYSPAGCTSPNVMVSTHLFPMHYLQWREDGIAMAFLRQPLGLSALAGLKHLNRLEQVMLKREVEALGVDDGVVCDINGHIIETSASNIFWRQENNLFTPRIDTSGVAGTMRAQVLEHAAELGYHVDEVLVPKASLLDADEIFITNAVMGVVPVRCLDKNHYSNFDACRAITLRLDV